ncbi:MAG: hypothetical protein ACFFBD_09175 [Candidatus Hodarchaeota archaeon]
MLNEIFFFLLRITFLVLITSLVLLLAIKWENTKFYKLVPILCGLLTSVLAFGYLFLFSLNGYFYGDTINVYEEYLVNRTEYFYAPGFSKLCLSLSTLGGFPIFNTLVWIGTIFTPFALYLAFYLFCTNFISEKMSILTAYMFSVIGVTFISFAANMKQNVGLLCVIICLHILLRENREKDGELKKSVLFTLSYGLLSAVHLFSFVIGTVILIPVIEVHNQLKEEDYSFLSINRHTGIILSSIPFFFLLFYAEALQVFFVFFEWIIRSSFKTNPDLMQFFVPIIAFLKFLSKNPFFFGFCFSLGFVGYLCGVKLILMISLYVQKITTRVFERGDRRIWFVIHSS